MRMLAGIGGAGMVRILLLVLCVAAATVHAQAAEIMRANLTFNGAERTYYLYVPDTPKLAIPLIVLLHGSGGEGSGILALWKTDAEANGIMLVAPNAANREKWNLRHDGPDLIHALVEGVAARHPVDRRRIYLFGQSAGAVYSLTLAMLESQYFAAMAVHAGAWRQTGEFAVMKLARRRIPMAIVIGDKDEYFSLGAVRRTEAALKHAGFPFELTVIPGHHHGYNPTNNAEINRIVWTFLSAHALDADPVYVPYR